MLTKITLCSSQLRGTIHPIAYLCVPTYTNQKCRAVYTCFLKYIHAVNHLTLTYVTLDVAAQVHTPQQIDISQQQNYWVVLPGGILHLAYETCRHRQPSGPSIFLDLVSQ